LILCDLGNYRLSHFGVPVVIKEFEMAVKKMCSKYDEKTFEDLNSDNMKATTQE